MSLEDIELTHRVDDPTPTITGMEDSSRAVRPLASADSRFTRYSLALRDLENPRILENRLSYRLHDVEWSNDSGRLAFGNMTYFEGIDIGEALAHEMAETHLCVGRSETVVARPSWRSLRLRKAVGDPFDFSRRSQLTSINTLTIRRSPTGASIVLHDRNAGNVAVGGGTIHVMPAGTFQPSSVLPEAHAMDFDLWHNMMREYSEEFLGHAEHGGDGAPADYSLPPFDLMCQARRDGRIRVWCLGVGLDALTLFGEVLTVVVFDADVYDELFADLVRTNDEGSVIQVGDRAAPSSAVPFDGFSLPRILEQPTLAPAAAGCLSLAWAHRDRLLA